MSCATKIYISLKLSRPLTEEEALELNSLKTIQLPEYCLFGEEIKAVGLYFPYPNFWKYENNELKLTKTETYEEYYYYLENLLYLIEYFFNPKQILLEGFIVSIEHIFGDLLYLHIHQNRIFLMKQFVEYFSSLRITEDLVDNLNQIFNLICQDIKKLI